MLFRSGGGVAIGTHAEHDDVGRGKGNLGLISKAVGMSIDEVKSILISRGFEV